METRRRIELRSLGLEHPVCPSRRAVWTSRVESNNPSNVRSVGSESHRREERVARAGVEPACNSLKDCVSRRKQRAVVGTPPRT